MPQSHRLVQTRPLGLLGTVVSDLACPIFLSIQLHTTGCAHWQPRKHRSHAGARSVSCFPTAKAGDPCGTWCNECTAGNLPCLGRLAFKGTGIFLISSKLAGVNCHGIQITPSPSLTQGQGLQGTHWVNLGDWKAYHGKTAWAKTPMGQLPRLGEW